MRTQVKDHVVPKGKWKFDKEVSDSFEDMLKRSIPQYEVMRRSVFDVACQFAKHKTAILDLGCSRGDALAPLVDRFGAYNRYVGVDVSEPMLEVARKRFAGLIRQGLVKITSMDLRTDYPVDEFSVTLSVLCLQFVPIEYRQQVVQAMHDQTLPGGCVVLVEKVLGASAAIDAKMVSNYLSLKQANGYTTEQIERKRLSLEGVLVPVTAKWNEELLRMAGFQQVDCFWRWFNFAGWVAIK